MRGKGLINRVDPEMYFKIKNGDKMTKQEIDVQTEAAKTEWFETKGYDTGFRDKSIFLENKSTLENDKKTIIKHKIKQRKNLSKKLKQVANILTSCLFFIFYNNSISIF